MEDGNLARVIDLAEARRRREHREAQPERDREPGDLSVNDDRREAHGVLQGAAHEVLEQGIREAHAERCPEQPEQGSLCQHEQPDLARSEADGAHHAVLMGALAHVHRQRVADEIQQVELVARQRLLKPGQRGFIYYYDDKPKSLRAAPGENSTLLFTLVFGVPFIVEEGGPVCANNMNWWKVRVLASTPVIGWVSEGSTFAGYWLATIDPKEFAR